MMLQMETSSQMGPSTTNTDGGGSCWQHSFYWMSAMAWYVLSYWTSYALQTRRVEGWGDYNLVNL